MATITQRTNKDGSTVYRIRVFGGRDSEGKQRIFQTTWKADPKRTESANKKALNKFAADYELKCLSGEVAEHRILFGTYCRKLVDDKQRDALIKISTANFYRSLYPLLHDIDGVSISLVNANTLNNLYRNLLDKPSISDTRYRLKAKTDLLKLGAVPNKTQFSKKYGIAPTTLNAVINSKSISQQTAARISEALYMPVSSLFNVCESGKRTLSASQLHKVHSLVSMVLSEALKDGLITYNPAERVRLPKVETFAPRYLESEEIGTLLTAAEREPMEVKVFVFLAVATGARRGELLGLQWSDVNFTFNQIEIRQAVYYRPAPGIYIDTPKNKTSQRFIRLPSEIMELLKDYKKEWDDFRNNCGTAFPQTVSISDGSGKQREFTADFLFFQSKNIGYPHAPDTANKWLKLICDKNGLAHINPHSLRHSAASALIFGGVDPASVAKYLGHTSPQTTEKVYAHALEESRSRNSNIIGDFMFKHKPAPRKEDKKEDVG